MSYCLTPVKMVIIKSTNHKRWRGCGQKGPSYPLVRMQSGIATMENSMQVPWKWKLLSRVQLFAAPWLYSPWNSPGQNTGVDSHPLLQGIFPTQGSNPGLLHCRQILYQLSDRGSPRILEWVACPFCRSSRHRNRTRVSCIADGFFTSWATGKSLRN